MGGTLEKSLNKLSTMVESFATNQKDLQASTSIISGAADVLQKLMQDLRNSTREATATSNQLSSTMFSYKEVLLIANSSNKQEMQVAATGTNEDPRLTRDLDRKQ